jgi:hypothetical protein
MIDASRWWVPPARGSPVEHFGGGQLLLKADVGGEGKQISFSHNELSARGAGKNGPCWRCGLVKKV